MRKMQLWATLKEILRTVDDWDEETFNNEMCKDEITFRKYLPKGADWNLIETYEIKIKISKKEHEEEISARESTKPVEKD